MKQLIAIVAVLGLIAGLSAKSYSIAYYGMINLTFYKYYFTKKKALSTYAFNNLLFEGFDIAVDPSSCDATVTETMTYSFSGGTFQGAERSIALNGYSGYPSRVNFISLYSPNTTTSVTANHVEDNHWVLQWSFPPR